MKAEYCFVPIDGGKAGPTVKMDVVAKTRILGIHKNLDGGKGYLLTHLETGRVVLRARILADAKETRAELEALDWDDEEAVRAAIVRLQAEHPRKKPASKLHNK